MLQNIRFDCVLLNALIYKPKDKFVRYLATESVKKKNTNISHKPQTMGYMAQSLPFPSCRLCISP